MAAGSLMLGAFSLVGAGPAAASTVTVDCSATSLQTAIDSASSGDTLDVSGTCTGNFTINKNLTLEGPATLDGTGYNGSVLTVDYGVTAALDSLTIEHGTTPGYGGGIYNAGTLSVTDSTLSGNSGGGIDNFFGTLSVTDSTLSGNSADHGGGIDNDGGTLSVTDSTLSGNSAYRGGGIYELDGTLTLTYDTLSGNLAGSAGGGIFEDASTATVTATIVAGNSPTDCSLFSWQTDAGYNLESGTSCGFSTSGTSLQNIAPDLGPLADNGGSTETMKPNPGAPEIAAIPDPTTGLCPEVDQTGASSGGAPCTIGSVFVAPSTTCTGGLTLTNTLDPASATGGSPGQPGTWTFDATAQNCTGGGLTGLNMQGGTGGWLKVGSATGDSSSGITVTQNSKNNNATITGTLASFPDQESATITVTVSGTVSKHATCGSQVPISGSWSASATASGTTTRSPYTDPVLITFTCP